MTLRRRTPTLVAALSLIAALSACESITNLAPAPSAESAKGKPQSAIATEADIQVVAAAPEWPGHYAIGSEVTPMRLVISNRGEQPISVRYSKIRLIDPSGTSYGALPLYQIKGEVETTVEFRNSRPIYEPGFRGQRFRPAPYYSMVYPHYPVYSGPFYNDHGYYDAYDSYFVGVELPTDRMREEALPEGVLEPGGRVEGWVYFEKVPEELPRVVLRTDLENARTGRTFGELRVPFVVSG